MYYDYMVKVPEQVGVTKIHKKDKTQQPYEYICYRLKYVKGNKVKYTNRIIGKQSPNNPSLMTPNENYYELFQVKTRKYSIFYDLYLGEHRKYVIKAYGWMSEHIPEVKQLMAGHEDILQEHDGSSYSFDEYDANDAFFTSVTPDTERLYHYARLKHFQRNPHHWQHWIFWDDDGSITPMEIPKPYVIEMLTDWWANSLSVGDPYEIFSYWQNFNPFVLHKNTRELIDRLLSELRKELDISNVV